MEKFPFKTDDGDIVWVEFDSMMNMEMGGFLVLPDGRLGRRVRTEEELRPKPREKAVEIRTNCISDSLGFTKKALPEYQQHLEQSGCKGIEFREDPDVPGFMQVVCDSQKAKLAYAKTRGFTDNNSSNGGSATLTAYDLENAKELAIRASSGSKSVDKRALDLQ